MMSNVLASGNPLDHVIDHFWKTAGAGGPFTTFTLMSNHVFMMIVAAVLLLVFIPSFVRGPATDDPVEGLTPRGKRNAIETICVFLRDFVARPNMGAYTDLFIPYVWTVFFFILTINLLGLLPLEPVTKPLAAALGLEHGVYGTATGNLWTTATLALCTLFMIVFNGLRLHGVHYLKHFFMGPPGINVFIAVLEWIGLLAKTFALSVRLFANMMAGHILLAVLLGFIGSAMSISLFTGFGVAVPVVLGSVAITLLELFVAFLQAFIFTFLSCVFIGQAVNPSHEEGHGEHGHEAGHGTGAGPHGAPEALHGHERAS
ncbi:MAG: F0F1 ATP synthase subunit A [Phycisphaerae bacterium]|jgi:F-type H+-transporting ATPase subunit a